MTTATSRSYTVEYDSNNSGGRWWLDDEDWRALEDAGWFVNWGGEDFCNSRFGSRHEGPSVAPNTHEANECPGHRRFQSYAEALASGERWLGSLAGDATIEVTSYSEPLAEEVARVLWTDAIGFKYTGNEEGCNCCGQPHYFRAKVSK